MSGGLFHQYVAPLGTSADANKRNAIGRRLTGHPNRVRGVGVRTRLLCASIQRGFLHFGVVD